jgi:hypothetical protein
MIFHAIQPMSDPSAIVIRNLGNYLLVDITNELKCERRTQEGGSIAIRYTARFEDGTVIGSSLSRRWVLLVV